MAAENVAVQQDTASGAGSDLPQGAASDINAALPTQTVPDASGQPGAVEPGAPAEGAPAAQAEDTSEPEAASPADYEPIYTPESDGDAFLTGPTTRPDENVTTGAFAGSVRPLSPRLAAAMPTFVEAASLPDAPEQLKALVALLARSAEA